ncbi:hypothetical protein [Cognatishimia sp.]|uniref:hypothetical protein n=1 Tax=Cognatishimia sp. TaxID=2211648 RepID=UPI0035190B8B|nr:hypothetical protein [Cognatishimia sp.]
MDNKKTSSGKAAKAQTREDRLKAALKANMGRRKAQAKARSAGSDETKTAEKNEG